MQTKNGLKVKCLHYIESSQTYVGEVNCKVTSWDSSGRKNGLRQSKFDLTPSDEYQTILQMGSRYLYPPRILTGVEKLKNDLHMIDIIHFENI